MKHLILFIILLTAVSVSFPQADYSNFNRYFGIQLNTGYTFFELNPLKDNFKANVDYLIKNYDIPLRIQRLYPNNLSWSGYLFWYFSPSTSLIIGPEFTSTKAFSRYQDYAGTLDLKSEFRQIYLSVDVRRHIHNVKYLQPFIGIGFALTGFYYDYNAELNINKDYVPANNLNYSSFTYSDFGYCAELCAGFDYNLKIAVLEFIALYRYSWMETLNFNPNTFNIRLGIQKGFFK